MILDVREGKYMTFFDFVFPLSSISIMHELPVGQSVAFSSSFQPCSFGAYSSLASNFVSGQVETSSATLGENSISVSR